MKEKNSTTNYWLLHKLLRLNYTIYIRSNYAYYIINVYQEIYKKNKGKKGKRNISINLRTNNP